MEKKLILSIIILNYNTYELTRQTLNSILNSKMDYNIEIILVDNCSTDRSIYKLEREFGYEVKIIKNNNTKYFLIVLLFHNS